jgi:hypothetical protein
MMEMENEKCPYKNSCPYPPCPSPYSICGFYQECREYDEEIERNTFYPPEIPEGRGKQKSLGDLKND